MHTAFTLPIKMSLSQPMSFLIFTLLILSPIPPTEGLNEQLCRVSCQLGINHDPFQYLKGAFKKNGERLFNKACSDRTRDNWFKLKKTRFKLNIRKKFFYNEGGETLDQVSQRSCEHLIIGNAQGQAGQGFEQPNLLQ